ncbi:MAG: response regulator, partial [bacterium]|nr:response regulator [bacterium]
QAAKQAEPYGYILKPFDEQDLGTTIEMALHKHRKEQEARRFSTQLYQVQRLEAMGQLAWGVAHHFNNLLSVIMGNLILAEKKVNREVWEKYLSVSMCAGEVAADLVQELNLFCRKQEYDRKPFDMSQLVVEVAGICRDTFSSDLVVHLEGIERMHLVFGDEKQLQQALLNLCINARDALEELSAPRLPRIDIRVAPHFVGGEQDARYVKISVQDNGVGMAEETRCHLFEPFFTTKDIGKGSGLGLATVYGVVCEHQGWIEYESQPGVGTTFCVYLPEVADQDGSDVQDGSGFYPILEDTRAGSKTILLIEDEPMIRRVSKEILEREGYRVLLAVDGEEGLEIFRREQDRIDLILLDMSMPKLSGEAVLRILKSEGSQIPVIVVTGHLHYSAQTLGVPGLIHKPFQYRELLQLVSNVLTRAI